MITYKKIVSLLIIPAVILCTIFESVHITNINVSAEVITTAYIDGTNVRVRTGPSTDHPIIERASNRTARVLGQTTGGGYTWYNITYHNGTEQITGYIAYDPSYIRIVEYNPDADFESQISAFPESYRTSLRELHAAYPNWNFIPDPIQNVSFYEHVALQSENMRKQVSMSGHPVSWRSMGLGSYDWSKKDWIQTNGGWTGASKEIIAYYMDPRNFLDDKYIYMFLLQSFDATLQNEEGVKKIIKGTFMESNYNDSNDAAYGGSYAKVIMAAGQAHNVNPYILASKIRQEIGVNETAMVSGKQSGYEGYYNFYNIGASGGSNYDVLINGLEKAKSSGWNSRSAAIIGGAKFLSNNYIGSGQDTYYLQDFNVHNTNALWHQYAQGVHDAYNKGYSLSSNYRNQPEIGLTFKIPVYNSMPANPAVKPVSNSLKNNYYIDSMSVDGLTPSFSTYKMDYTLQIYGNTTINITPKSDASVAGEKVYNINSGYNYISIPIKAENGNLNYYNISVNSSVNCVITIIDTLSSSNPTPAPPPQFSLGDTNSDNKIDIIDLAKVQMHILNLKPLSGNSILAADTNSDGKVDIIDLAKVQMHILGIKLIK